MQLHLRTRKGWAHFLLIVEKQEHHQHRYPDSKHWSAGYMESANDVQTMDYLVELYPHLQHHSENTGIEYRRVTRSRFEFAIRLGHTRFELNRFTPWAPLLAPPFPQLEVEV